jgi:FimV-like protein
MMIAIFRANPHAFEGNINRLHRGALLSIPALEDVQTIDAADAKREVHTQMTAWRLDGRPVAPHRIAADSIATPAPNAGSAPTPTPQANKASVDASANDALKGRVQSLEVELDNMNRQLKELTARTLAAAAAAEPAAAPATASSSAPAAAPATATAPTTAAAPASSSSSAFAAAPASPSALAAAPAPVIAPATLTASAPSSSPVHVEVMHVKEHPSPILAATAPEPPAQAMSNKMILGPMAVALALLLAGFAYVRRQILRGRASSEEAPALQESASSSNNALGQATPIALPTRDHADAAPMSRAPLSRAPLSRPVEIPPQVATGSPAASEIPRRATLDETTQSLQIDVEALERSYLDMGVDTLGIDPAAGDPAADHHSAADDTATHPMTAVDASAQDTAILDASMLETVVIDKSELDTAVTRADLDTAVIDTKKAEPVNTMILDYNLLDLDATVQHVQMPSELHDHVVVSERRTNIVDVLKTAIDRDPHRRDLRMKLLETYYSAAATNQRAFLDVVRKLARERDFLSNEDWQKVVMMGREIASEDILFAARSKDDDLANCA